MIGPSGRGAARSAGGGEGHSLRSAKEKEAPALTVIQPVAAPTRTGLSRSVLVPSPSVSFFNIGDVIGAVDELNGV